MSLPFENALQRDRERQRRQREGGQHTDLSARMDTPTLSPAGVGSPLAPPPLDISSMTDMVTELTRPVDRAQLDQEIEDFNVPCPVNVDDALNLFNLPPEAGVGTAPTTTTTIPPFTTTSTRTRPVTSTRTRPVTATATVPTPSSNRPRLVTSTMTRPTTATPARGRAGAGTLTTTSTVTTPSTRSRIAAKQQQRRPAASSAPFPPPSDDDGDDDNDDRRRGLRRRLDLLNEDATCSRQAYSKYHAHQYSDRGLRRRGRATLCAPYLDSNLQSKSTLHTTTLRTWPWLWLWSSAWTSSTLVKKDIKTASSIKQS